MAHYHHHQSQSWGSPPDCDYSSDDDLESDDGYDSASSSGSIDSEFENDSISNCTTSPQLSHTYIYNFDDSDYDSSDNESDHGPISSCHSPSHSFTLHIPPRRYPAPGSLNSSHMHTNDSIESLVDEHEHEHESDAFSASECGCGYDCQARSPRTFHSSAPYASTSVPYLSLSERRCPEQRHDRYSGSRGIPRRAHSDESYRRSSGQGQFRDEIVRSRGQRCGEDGDRSGHPERYREPEYGGDSEDEEAEQGGLARFARFARLGIRALGSGLGG
ncbi:hypothetical protein ACMFMF_003881 [Clarireedia jacksonii]